MTEEFHVVVTGSRDWPPSKAWIIWEHLARIQEENSDKTITLHEGECPFGGADLIAASWAAGAGWIVQPHPPEQFTGAYYAKRNREMIDSKPDKVLAFFLSGHKNAGTQMTYNMAFTAGLDPIKVLA